MKGEEKLSKAIARAFRNSADKYTEGYCVEFAIALSRQLPNSRLLVGARTYTNNGQEYYNDLSHVVVGYKKATYDVMGAGAIARWEGYYTNPYDCGGDEEVEFQWEEYNLKELRELVKEVRTGRKTIDQKIILEVSKILKEKIKYPKDLHTLLNYPLDNQVL